MTMVYGARESTKDIDALFAPTNEIRVAVAKIAEDNDLNPDWLNDAAKGFIDTTKMQFENVFELSNLRVRRPTDEEMLAMKLASAREYTSDESDALYLMKRLGMEDFDSVLDIMERYIHADALTPLSFYFAENVFNKYTENKDDVS